MALIRKPTSSSSAPLDDIKPWKIKVQILRMWKGNKKESGNSIEMVLLDSSGAKIHTTIDEAFSKWIMDIADGKVNDRNDGEIEIDILEDLLITERNDPFEVIVKQVYGGSFARSYNPDLYQKSTILCSTNNDVDQINDYMLSHLSGEEKVYLSADSISPSDSDPSDYMVYPPELLNSIKVPGLPSHSLRLKVGAPVMLLKDILPNDGLCNGTRLQITRLGNFVLEAKIMTGDKAGEKVLIPRIYAYPTEANFPIKMRRKQFPLTLAFAMTIDKSEGQTLSKIGIFQPRRAFSHGPVYVAISKVKSRDGLKILLTDKDEKLQERTMNVVFKEVLQNI